MGTQQHTSPGLLFLCPPSLPRAPKENAIFGVTPSQPALHRLGFHGPWDSTVPGIHSPWAHLLSMQCWPQSHSKWVQTGSDEKRPSKISKQKLRSKSCSSARTLSMLPRQRGKDLPKAMLLLRKFPPAPAGHQGHEQDFCCAMGVSLPQDIQGTPAPLTNIPASNSTHSASAGSALG